MTDKKQSDKPERKVTQGYKPWLRKSGRGQGKEQIAKKKDPEEVPILTFGPNNNFAKFKEASSKALREYGDLGRLIDAGKYYSAEPPEPTDYDLVNDPYGLNCATFLEQQKLYMRHWEDMINDRPKLYAMTW
jgi:hypothetical protein